MFQASILCVSVLGAGVAVVVCPVSLLSAGAAGAARGIRAGVRRGGRARDGCAEHRAGDARGGAGQRLRGDLRRAGRRLWWG